MIFVVTKFVAICILLAVFIIWNAKQAHHFKTTNGRIDKAHCIVLLILFVFTMSICLVAIGYIWTSESPGIAIAWLVIAGGFLYLTDERVQAENKPEKPISENVD